MSELPKALAECDWRLATWEGSRAEQLRRWSRLPLAQIIAAIEEMEDVHLAIAAGPRAAPKDVEAVAGPEATREEEGRRR